jgi:hypothetical protein
MAAALGGSAGAGRQWMPRARGGGLPTTSPAGPGCGLAGRQRRAFVARWGPGPASPPASAWPSASRPLRVTRGAWAERRAGPRTSPPAAPASAATPRGPRGGASPGRPATGGGGPRAHALLRRRARGFSPAPGRAHVCAGGPDARPARGADPRPALGQQGPRAGGPAVRPQPGPPPQRCRRGRAPRTPAARHAGPDGQQLGWPPDPPPPHRAGVSQPWRAATPPPRAPPGACPGADPGRGRLAAAQRGRTPPPGRCCQPASTACMARRGARLELLMARSVSTPGLILVGVRPTESKGTMIAPLPIALKRSGWTLRVRGPSIIVASPIG